MALQEKFREHGVVPDVIDEPPAELAIVRCAPSVLQRQRFVVFLLTQVKYDCGVTVEPGAILTPTQVRRETPYKEALVLCVILYLLQVQNAPVVTWPAEDSALYTLIMTGKPPLITSL